MKSATLVVFVMAVAFVPQSLALRCYTGLITDSDDNPEDFPATENTVPGIEVCQGQNVGDVPVCYKVRVEDDGDFKSYYGCNSHYLNPVHWTGNIGIRDNLVLAMSLPNPQDEECDEKDSKTDPTQGLGQPSDNEVKITTCSCTGDYCNGSMGVAAPAVAVAAGLTLLARLF
jgi:hypothetical protein